MISLERRLSRLSDLCYQVYKLNILLTTEKDEIVEKSLAYLNSHRSYYTQGGGERLDVDSSGVTGSDRA